LTRINAYQASVHHAQQVQDAHAAILARIDGDIARYNDGDQALRNRWRDALASITNDPDRILPAIRSVVDETDTDGLSREQKRSIMQALDVKVKLYPSKSEYAKTHGQRWEFLFSD
jgi:hypothetical protein